MVKFVPLVYDEIATSEFNKYSLYNVKFYPVYKGNKTSGDTYIQLFVKPYQQQHETRVAIVDPTGTLCIEDIVAFHYTDDDCYFHVRNRLRRKVRRFFSRDCGVGSYFGNNAFRLNIKGYLANELYNDKGPLKSHMMKYCNMILSTDDLQTCANTIQQKNSTPSSRCRRK